MNTNEVTAGAFNAFLRAGENEESAGGHGSFRDMRNERNNNMNVIGSGRVIDLQHIQPFSNKSLGGNTSEGTSEFQGLD